MGANCEEDAPTNQESELADLMIAKKAIEDLAATSVCNEAFTCEAIAFGSKPCGGPTGYLVYSTSIDIEKLEKIVFEYNKSEADYNSKWGVISDCALVTPPATLKCENNKCVAVY